MYQDIDIAEPLEKDFEQETLLSREFQSRQYARRSPKWHVLSLVSWIITLTVVGLYAWDRWFVQTSTYERGWHTDFVSSRQIIETERKVFTGAPTITDDGDVVVLNKDPISYVGKPSPEIDMAWEQLVGGRYFLITEDEAKATWGNEYKDYWSYDRGGYVAGLDIFHTLHCLDRIRRSLNPEYYPSHSHAGPEAQMIHSGHCIEQIRQYIMCAGDLTALGTKYFPGLGRNYVLSDVPHTCRNFDKIRKWSWDRFNGSTSVKPVYHIPPKQGHL